MRKAPKSVLFVTAIALGIGLTGCSAGGQSVADACKVISNEGTAITTSAQEAMGSVASDPEAAVAALGDVQKQFEDLRGKITNAEVKPLFDDFVSAYGELTDTIGTIADDPENASDSMTAISEATTKVGDAGTAMNKVCA